MEAISTLEMDRKEWLQLRKSGIGGSDASAILGFNRYKSAFQLYIEKTSELVEESDSEAAYWGNVLEDIVAREFAKRTGKKIRRLNKMLRHPKHYFMTANLDRDVVGEKAFLECKTASEYLKDSWNGEDVPAAYLCQLQHYLAVTGYEKAYIAVLIGGNKFVWKEVDRDDEFIELMIQHEKAFWENHVLANVPPAIDGSSSASELLAKMYPQDDGSAIMLDEQSNTLIEAIESIKTEEKQLELQRKEYENQLKMTLGESAEGHSDRFKVTYKTITSSRLDSKRLKEEQPAIYEKYIKDSLSRRLSIKEAN
ncbi:YqaJ viral recombinase family nuclease [Lysinibacillus fusiformis]|uniref:YqaJ viral recombinase family nuclease n=1 Tax=Lysinibacillus fusiformis TaxID=28031 RepID=UPI00263A97D7|nr:YqaJ viral recombinase family protein [Lysinibacillus fusiformis]MDC6268050.1 YqaJ viral recombinase family protein [Lysinibacillus sphaericus]MDN4967460.1 YqaJ viral recombinase family protein [Lysinibacillus fusiformis]